MASGKIPAFFNHLESGQFSLTSGETGTWVNMQQISLPKGILIYSNAFDITSAKEDKPLLGAYCAYYIAGTDELTPGSDGNIAIGGISFYLTNWGRVGATNNPISYNTSATSRGLDAIKPTNKAFHIRGFGTTEYDFKTEITYNWIAWD